MSKSKCELCGARGVTLSSGLVICPECFWNKLNTRFIDERFSGASNGRGHDTRKRETVPRA